MTAVQMAVASLVISTLSLANSIFWMVIIIRGLRKPVKH